MSEPLSIPLYPVVGLYRYRFGKDRPWVPARIDLVPARDPETGEEMDRSLQLRCVVGGELMDAWEVWPMHPVTREEFNRLCESMPDDPRAVRDFSNGTLF